jgi:hypothetical protein
MQSSHIELLGGGEMTTFAGVACGKVTVLFNGVYFAPLKFGLL